MVSATQYVPNGWFVASVQLPSAPLVQVASAVPLQVVPVGAPENSVKPAPASAFVPSVLWMLIVPQLLISVVLYPVNTRLVALLDRIRLLPLKRI